MTLATPGGDGVIKRLERDKLVERIADGANKRNRLARLTPKGNSSWQNLAGQINEFYNQATGHSGPEAHDRNWRILAASG
ncbi:MAG: hypothetical protein V9G24_03045 [Rhodoblastus sp.]